MAAKLFEADYNVTATHDALARSAWRHLGLPRQGSEADVNELQEAVFMKSFFNDCNRCVDAASRGGWNIQHFVASSSHMTRRMRSIVSSSIDCLPATQTISGGTRPIL